MPLYLYQNPQTEEVKEVFQTMAEEHVYQEDGVQWKRLYLAPNVGVDSLTDYSTIEGWRKHTQKKGTVGDIMDASSEASEMRKERNGGVDPVKERFYQKYSEKRNGRKHPDVVKRETNKSLEKMGIEIT